MSRAGYCCAAVWKAVPKSELASTRAAGREETQMCLTHCGIPFNICSPAGLGRLEAILMPDLHFLLQNLIQSHFYRFPALVMSLVLLQHELAISRAACMHARTIVAACKALCWNIHTLLKERVAPAGLPCYNLGQSSAMIEPQGCGRHAYLIQVISGLLHLFKGSCMFNAQPPADTKAS